MKRNRVLTAGLGLLVALSGAFGLAACGGSDDGGSGSSAGTAETTQASVDVAEDLENARQAILDTLAEDDHWTQIMLASDVQAPTQKYGLLVVPYSFSEAASRVQGTITITDGSKFTIDADSAATGQTWRIDQDGNITEVTD